MRIIINGVAGKMGRELVKALVGQDDLQLCGGCDVTHVGEDIGDLAGVTNLALPVVDELALLISSTTPDVVVDFTNPAALRANIPGMLAAGVHIVVGTSGVDATMVAEIGEACHQHGAKVIIAPNFAIGAVLMMKFAGMAAEYMQAAEIIELHHDRKLDAPSGTAIRTAELIKQGWENKLTTQSNACTPSPTDNAFRGGRVADVPVHSIRLPGLMAHQEAIFGAPGQVLTIRHDALNRESFIPGILFAIRRVSQVQGVVYGLENLL